MSLPSLRSGVCRSPHLPDSVILVSTIPGSIRSPCAPVVLCQSAPPVLLSDSGISETAPNRRQPRSTSRSSGRLSLYPAPATRLITAIINGIRRQGSVRKEIELEILVSDTLKTAILHGRMLGKGMELTSTANIRTATEEEISECDHSLTENLQMWGQGDVQAPWEALRTLWKSEHDLDHDADDNWCENLFLTGTALGVETEKSLNDGQLCDLLGWSPEKGIPAAFHTHVHEDPVMPPVKDGSEVSERMKQVQIHWHQKELKHFRSQPNIPVLTISNVAATGLNIAYCSPLILHDVGWSKVHSNQIDGRIHCQGQREQTYSFQMASDRTIDTLLLANGRNKGHLLNTFLSVGRNRSEFIAAAMAHVMINLNNTADADEIWEYLEEKSGLSHLDVQQ
ncbi:hypothetical protein B0H16DRAFT_1744837 [Mycena metata]|uniref:Helicase C-terminal domain-containing protein n=1 Tax=Mycena metata TaxID=1033252 RepID=A0AAD7H4H7_9AGAR|nr:hypothetical protein B0H16DRAFT_1744837 [Mycena metata]